MKFVENLELLQKTALITLLFWYKMFLEWLLSRMTGRKFEFLTLQNLVDLVAIGSLLNWLILDYSWWRPRIDSSLDEDEWSY